MTKTKKVLCVLLLSAVVMVMSIHYWMIYFHIPGWEPWFVSTSPDGRFTVSAYQNNGLAIRLFAMPGDGGGWGAGTFVIREKKTGKVLHHGIIDNIPAVEGQVFWEDKSVYIGYVGTFNLSPATP